MIQSNKRDIPAYVYRFVKIHVTTLIRTSYFNFDEKDDLTHELLLFYLDKFFCLDPAPSEELIFISLKNHAKNLLRKKITMFRNTITKYSLDDLEACGVQISDNTSLADIDNKIALKQLMKHLSQKEANIIQMIMDGHSFEDLVKNAHISYSTISRICKKIKKR